MASLTIRNLDEPLKKRLRIQAAHNGRSMEEEVRQILRKVLETASPRPDAPELAAPPMRISPPVHAPIPDAPAFAPLTLVAGSDTDRAAHRDDPPPPAPASTPPTAAPAVSPAAPVSVEAFTDGLRQRLALLVGVEAPSIRRET